MSAQELITEHLDLWTGAVTKKSASGRGNNGKIELTGVKRLRELILELAVRGSLVDQDTSDEPAQKLLEQCLKAKAVSVELGKLKKVRKHASITNDDTSFSLPQGWVWSRLDDVVRVINGRAYKKHEMLSSGTPLLRVGNLFTSNDWYYSDLELEDDKYIDSGDLIYAWSASFGPFIWDGGRAIYHYHIWKLDLFDEAAIDKRFLYLYLKAVTEEIKSSGSGIAMIHMTKSKMEELIVPVPPLKEQHRIVQKVDELMALCDRLEQQTNDQLEAHETLVDTLLGTLTQSENATELADNWTRLAAHFDTLFTTEQSIDKLKQTILQLAVMGRLVEQDAGDEPGSTFVSKMLKARDHLASNEGMRTKAGNDVSPDEKYLSLPDTWEWIKLGNIAKFIDYRGKTPIKTSHGKRLITAKNIRQGYIDLEPEEFISEEDYTEWMTRGFPRKGDLLFTPEAPLGNAAIVDLNEEFALAQRAICFQWHILDISRFMLIQIMASPFQEKLVENATGMTATGIKASKLKEIPVAIPPLKEQHRIVQKVDELMALCDQLKERLNRARGTRCQLAETIVQQALS
ncbi:MULTISPECIES: restriction endonuclease subunit S [unclassified Marinimicrobium]|uniref:restriction endonuclease subunit S n=1 Tax=unclassified Marinimicrobium TaxID=2632100 RepID=UPI0025808A1D|nr:MULTISPECIES: restriction endonuclease subunit S [unclassified Marinimicrobium]